jgi:VanZ family protein
MTKKQMGLVGNMLAILLILCFIFGNSLLSGEESGEMSASVLDVLHPVIRPAAELFSRDPVTEDQLHHLVRKLAHFTEFAALGLCSALLLWQCCRTLRTPYFGYLLFFTLMTAVCDEFLQSFTGRGPSVRDVLIDFSGAFTGILLLWLITELTQKDKR